MLREGGHGESSATSASAGRVLLVEDDPGIMRAYSRWLVRAGLEVATAETGAEAIKKLKSDPGFHVVVSDISMPEMDGMRLLRAVRQHDLDVPVVLMTGNPSVETAMQAVEYGAFRYVPKPVDLDDLLEIVRAATKLRRLAELKRQSLVAIGEQGRSLGDRSALEVRFDQALDHLWIAFQPIVHWSERLVFAYEALVRSEEASISTPAGLFDAAARLGRLHDLGRAVRARVASRAAEAPRNALLFVNIHPEDLGDDYLFSREEPLSAIAERVVLEITERSSLERVEGLGARIATLRAMGYLIAIDDLGAGYAGLSAFSQLNPDFVKLDRELIHGLDASARKRSIVRAMLKLCGRELGIRVISEGVETTGERDALVMEGGDLLQGYLFAKPTRRFRLPSWQAECPTRAGDDAGGHLE